MTDTKRKKIVLTGAQREENRRIALFLLENGHCLTLAAEEKESAETFAAQLPEEQRKRCFVAGLDSCGETEAAKAMERAAELMEGWDVLINGLPKTDETLQLEGEPDSFGQKLAEEFRKIFLINREAARYMVRQKYGSIVFLLIDDVLHYGGYPVSPVKNQGRISLMKSMAKELSPFNIQVNTLTFGLYDRGLQPAEKRAMQKKLEFCALKPPLPSWEDLLPALESLIYPAFPYMTGQNYTAAIGTSNT